MYPGEGFFWFQIRRIDETREIAEIYLSFSPRRGEEVKDEKTDWNNVLARYLRKLREGTQGNQKYQS